MKFILIDNVLALEADRIVAVKQVSLAEEYLADHFPTFPVLPGVLMIEAMAQAARTLIAHREGSAGGRHVLGEVKALKFGSFVRPGEALEVEVTMSGPNENGEFTCKGTGLVRGSAARAPGRETAVSGRFTMRPLRTRPRPRLHDPTQPAATGAAPGTAACPSPS